MSDPEPQQRYRAEVHTVDGLDKKAFFDAVDKAHDWVMSECEALKGGECAGVIFDQRNANKRVFVLDPYFLLPSRP